MKKIATLLLLTVVLGACEQTKQPVENKTSNENTEQQAPIEFNSDIERISYALGALQGSRMANQASAYEELALDPELLIRGFNDGVRGNNQMDSEQLQAAFNAYRTQLRTAQTNQKREQATRKTGENKSFLKITAEKEGVVATESGLLYEVLEAGDGENFPQVSDIVKVNYLGKLTNGKQFDSSYDKGRPSAFPLNRVIKGWTEGIQLMSKGAKFRLYVPPHLGYGATDRPKIPANSILIFEVKLLDIQQADDK